MAPEAPEQRFAEPAEVLQAGTAGDLPVKEDTQPPSQRRLIDDEVQVDPGAHPAGVRGVQGHAPRRQQPALPGRKACAEDHHDTSMTGVVVRRKTVTVKYLNPPELLQSPSFSHAVVVEQPARTIYVGGQKGVDVSGAVVGDLAEQTAQAVDNVRVILASAGAELTDVISWSVAVVAGQDLHAGYAAMGPALAGRQVPPIVTVLLVAGLAVPGALVELSAVAVLP